MEVIKKTHNIQIYPIYGANDLPEIEKTLPRQSIDLMLYLMHGHPSRLTAGFGMQGKITAKDFNRSFFQCMRENSSVVFDC
ncbi:MAG: hypothetical protein V4487_05130, partial [Chlamydiota bacterium]